MFTGGCHYPLSCNRYLKSCGLCPQLDSKTQWDLSRWTWKRKKKYWQRSDLVIVTPSRWLAQCAKSSSLLRNCRVEVIPNGLDTNVFKPIDQSVARAILNLPTDKRIILAGSVNAVEHPRKGFQYVLAALKDLASNSWKDKVELAVFGATGAEQSTDTGLTTRYLGYYKDEVSLALIYSAADVFVAPSVQENLANTVMESMACGTPCVAFNIGGMPDMIEHKRTGYLARPCDADDLSQGIAWLLSDEVRLNAVSLRAREKVMREYTLRNQAQRYIDLFRELQSGTK